MRIFVDFLSIFSHRMGETTFGSNFLASKIIFKSNSFEFDLNLNAFYFWSYFDGLKVIQNADLFYLYFWIISWDIKL